MRLDEESYIRSHIAYNLVDFMSVGNLKYAYRSSFVEWPTSACGFPETLAAYIAMSGITPTMLFKHCTPPGLEGLSAAGWDRRVVYNNFFLSSVSFWRRPDVQKLLHFIDRSGGIYTHRWGDALIHAAVVQMFLLDKQVHKFSDWTYEHSTLWPDGSLRWGGIVVGSADPKAARAAEEFAQKHARQYMCIEDNVCG